MSAVTAPTLIVESCPSTVFEFSKKELSFPSHFLNLAPVIRKPYVVPNMSATSENCNKP